MSLDAKLSHNGGTVVVRVPLKRRWRGGRRLTVAADNRVAASESLTGQASDDPILKALGRAWRWKSLLEKGNCASLADLATAEKVDKSYLSRLLRLTLLSPSIIESILDGTLSREVLLADLIDCQVVNWAGQGRKTGRAP